MKKYITNLLSVLTVLVALFSVSSCKKDKTNVGNVYVKDEDGSPVPGADVILFYADNDNASNNNPENEEDEEPKEEIQVPQKTDSKGYTQFVLELPSVYDIRATHPSDGRVVESLLILNEPGSTVTKILTFE